MLPLIQKQKFTILFLGLFGALTGGCGLLIGIEEAYVTQEEGGGINLGKGLTFSAGSCNADIDLDREVVEGCLLRVSCDPLLPPFSLSDCVTYSWQLSSTKEACGYKAGSCEDIEDCVHREWGDEDDAVLCQGGETWVCDGDEAIRCSDYPYKEDCSASGATCRGGGDAATGCTPPSDPDCSDKQDGDWHCNGNDLYTCSGGVSYGWDCAANATACIEPSPGLAFCNQFTNECDDPAVISCNNDALEVCYDTGHFAKFDCAVSELSCETSGSSSGNCLAEGCKTDEDCEEGCLDDFRMQLCIGGAKVELDCREFEFDTCYESELVSGAEFAGCRRYAEASYGADDSCQDSRDGTCGEWLSPGDFGYCAKATDATDCGDLCTWSHDGVCDEDAGPCESGTDTTDCLLQ